MRTRSIIKGWVWDYFVAVGHYLATLELILTNHIGVDGLIRCCCWGHHHPCNIAKTVMMIDGGWNGFSTDRVDNDLS